MTVVLALGGTCRAGAAGLLASRYCGLRLMFLVIDQLLDIDQRLDFETGK